MPDPKDKPADANANGKAPTPATQPTTDKPTQANPQTASAEDKNKPTDPDAEHSVGGANPMQTTGAGLPNTGTDAQGQPSAEADHFASHGEPPAAATVGSNVTAIVPGKPPAEGAGYTPAPAPNTGDADSNRVGYTQATQRLVRPDDAHPLANTLGEVGNIPPGSRPMMVDWHGVGVVPPQQQSAPEGG